MSFVGAVLLVSRGQTLFQSQSPSWATHPGYANFIYLFLTLFPGLRTEFYSKVEQNTTGGYVGMVVKGHKRGIDSAFNDKLVGIALFPSVDHSPPIHL